MTLKEQIEAAARRFESTMNVENRLSVTMQCVLEDMQYIYFFNENLDGLSSDEQVILAAEINAGRKRINAMGGIDIVPEKTPFQEADDELQKNIEEEAGKDTDDFFAKVKAGTLGKEEAEEKAAAQEQIKTAQKDLEQEHAQVMQ